MLTPNPAALDFLMTRRSRLAKTLDATAPSREEVETILTAAARTPDHGILAPFRFLILTNPARARLAKAVSAGMLAAGEEADRAERQATAMTNGGLAIAVVFSPKASEKIPEWEQLLAAGGVCLTVLNTALALGYGANWLTGWAAENRAFLTEELGLADREFVAGFIHIGKETITPKDRRRADVAALTEWVEA